MGDNKTQNFTYNYGGASGQQVAISKTADYTITVDDIIKGVVIVCNTTAGDVTLTLPQLSTLPDDGILQSFSIGHSGGGNDVILKTNASDNFVYDSTSTEFNLGNGNFHFTLAGVYNGSTGRWGFQRNLTIKAQMLRTTDWTASNFSSMTIIPFESENYNNNDELLVDTTGASAKYTVKTSGSYKVNYKIDIDSTGGSTWNATAQLCKNGTSLGEGYKVKTGNYGNEDGMLGLPTTYLDLDADDYIDLRIDQNNLTGKLIRASLSLELRI